MSEMQDLVKISDTPYMLDVHRVAYAYGEVFYPSDQVMKTMMP